MTHLDKIAAIATVATWVGFYIVEFTRFAAL